MIKLVENQEAQYTLVINHPKQQILEKNAQINHIYEDKATNSSLKEVKKMPCVLNIMYLVKTVVLMPWILKLSRFT